MDNNYRYGVEYSENVAPKYPAPEGQEGLEVVQNSTIYASPIHPTTPYVVGSEKRQPAPVAVPMGWGAVTSPATTIQPPSAASETAPAAPEAGEEELKKDERKRILGLTVPIFWLVVVIIIIILAAGIGGGVGSGLAQQSKSNSESSSVSQESSLSGSSGASGAGASPTSSSSPAASTPTATTGGPVPVDGGCPAINGQNSTPYAVDGNPIPLEKGGSPQEFRMQCATNYVASAAARTHNILRIFMPTLENCIMACAEYNSAYRAGLNAGAGVGGGYCVAVTIEKIENGFCYLKNGTATNDTLGQPRIYSSAVLLTDTDS
ncbi:hypothetical protein GGS23DRAFT_550429 [Durotheca rogersii]|uniref:uncharacterized protein n=1 Tax=Durotheca rogersii TaxID=419775 RepID=UPI0022202209|nr:uncharacterized protein GGS23DRAFT_550429 [Durotheca rogersii]KAI5867864.1 hypothetical protein GGS23DRAFT_550429 [Durotheca rogersii]